MSQSALGISELFNALDTIDEACDEQAPPRVLQFEPVRSSHVDELMFPSLLERDPEFDRIAHSARRKRVVKRALLTAALSSAIFALLFIAGIRAVEANKKTAVKVYVKVIAPVADAFAQVRVFTKRPPAPAATSRSVAERTVAVPSTRGNRA